MKSFKQIREESTIIYEGGGVSDSGMEPDMDLSNKSRGTVIGREGPWIKVHVPDTPFKPSHQRTVHINQLKTGGNPPTLGSTVTIHRGGVNKAHTGFRHVEESFISQLPKYLQEGWVQGRPPEAKWKGKYVKHTGGWGKVTNEYSKHVDVFNGTSHYPIMKSDVVAHHIKGADSDWMNPARETGMQSEGTDQSPRGPHGLVVRDIKNTAKKPATGSPAKQAGVGSSEMQPEGYDLTKKFDKKEKIKHHFDKFHYHVINGDNKVHGTAYERKLADQHYSEAHKHAKEYYKLTGKKIHGIFPSKYVTIYNTNESIEQNVNESKNKKFLGKFRGKTATGEKANPIDTEPELHLNKGKALKAVKSKGY